LSGFAGLALRGRRPPPPAPLEAMGAALAHRGAPAGTPSLGPGLGLLGLGAAVPVTAGAATLVTSHPPCGVAARREGLPPARLAELPLLLYRRRGLDFAAGLGGAHALAMADHAMRRLVLARDGFGLAPLYLAETREGIAFASEPGALLAAGLVTRRLRPSARDELLQIGFTTGDETIFEGIRRVLPGECLAIAEGAVVERRRSSPLPEGGPEPIAEEAALVRFEEGFLGSLAARLDGGAALVFPGGAGAAALAAGVLRLSRAAVPAFAPVLEGQAPLPGGPGVEIVPVPVTAASFWACLPALAAALDDPAAEPALALHWLVATAARGQVRALLSAEGASELLAGHGRHRAAMRPWWLWGRAMRARGAFDRLEVLSIEPRAWRDGIAAAEAAEAGGGRSRLQVAQAVDMGDWLANGLLAGLDRCAARHGLEARAPFLDPAVVAAAFRLPDALKVRDGDGQHLLRRWLGVAPPGPVRLPLGAWLEAEAARLGPLVARQPGIAEACRPGRVEALFRRAGERRAGRAAWTLLFYALWHQVHIAGRPVLDDAFATLG